MVEIAGWIMPIDSGVVRDRNRGTACCLVHTKRPDFSGSVIVIGGP